MSDLRTAAQQALNSLRGYRREIGCEQPCDAERLVMAALEQPEQEPVAWMTPGQDLHLNNGEGFRFSDWTPLYTHPPRREWQELSNGEIYTAYITATNQTLRPQDERLALAFARAIEAELKERNA